MFKSIAFASLFILGLGLAAGCMASANSTDADSRFHYQVLAAGSGQTAAPGDVVTIHLVGWLAEQETKGTCFIDTGERGQPISFKLGTDRVMPAWNLAVEGMQAGGKRRLFVPSALGYGPEGVEGLVPPDADLIFEIELLEVQKD